jgi:hypothetical protein
MWAANPGTDEAVAKKASESQKILPLQAMASLQFPIPYRIRLEPAILWS